MYSSNAPMSASVFDSLVVQAEDKAAMFTNHLHTHEYLAMWFGSWRENLRLKEMEFNKNKKRPN